MLEKLLKTELLSFGHQNLNISKKKLQKPRFRVNLGDFKFIGVIV